MLVNGGFETSDFSGWTKSVQFGSSGNAFVVPNVSGVSSLSGFLLPQLSTGGQYYAVTGQSGQDLYALTQLFPTDGTSSLSVSFDDGQINGRRVRALGEALQPFTRL